MKVKELFLFSESSFYNEERVLKRAMSRRKKKILMVFGALGAALLVFLTAALILGRLFQNPEEDILIEGSMQIIESVESTKGVLHALPLDAALKIKTSEDISAGEMKARLELSPALDFKVRRTAACSYQVSLDGLEKNSLYNLKAVYNGVTVDSWAFQTVAPFEIVSVSPVDDRNDINSAVEIRFSHAEVEGFEEAFSIEPEIEGRFEHYGNTWSFIPAVPMEEGALYNVTLKKTVKGPDGQGLPEDYQFSFLTDYGNSYAYLINGESGVADTFSVKEAPVAVISCDLVDLSEAKIKVYAFGSADSYIEAYQKYVRCGVVSPQIKASADDPHYQFTSKPAAAENYGPFESAAFIQYPETLPKGYYFSEIEVGGRLIYQLFQISDLSVYALSSGSDYVVWVNDALAGTPASKVKVELEGFPATETAGSGVAVLKGAKEQKALRSLKVGEGELPFVAILQEISVEDEILQQDYYSYLTSDSPSYRPGDKVGLFGAVLPRSLNGKSPDSVILKSEAFEEDLVIKTDANGAFTAEFTMPQGMEYPSVSVWVGEALLKTVSLHALDEAPAYRLSVSVDKKVYILGETVTFSGMVTDENGLPASGVAVSDGGVIDVVSDENGRFSGTFPVPYDENAVLDSVRPANLQLQLADDYNIVAICRYLVLASDYFLEAEYNDGKLSVGAFSAKPDGADHWDLDAFATGNYDENKLKGAPADISLYAELHEISYRKIEEGETYDPLSRKVQTKWSCMEQDIIVESYDAQTVNGITAFQLPKLDGEKRYYVNLYAEGAERPTEVFYLKDDRYENEYTSGKTFELIASQSECSVGEEVSFKVIREDDHSGVNEGSVLYAVVSDGIQNVSYSTSTYFSLEFKEEYAPDIWVYAAYFDGKHCYSLGREYLAYRKGDSELRIEMERSSEQVAPGDEVTLKFKAFDSSGNAVQASLNVSLIDLGLIQINEIEEPLAALYAPRCISSLASSYSSYRDFNETEDLGDGAFWEDGQWSQGYKKEEAALFKTVELDQRGEGSLTFTMPQSMTEWRVVARAISKKGMAGVDVFSLIPQKSLTTHVVLPDSFDISEKCKLSVMAEGKGLTSADVCTFKIGITDHEGAEISSMERQGISGHYVHLDLGILPADAYTVYVQVKAGHFEDSKIAFFEVMDQAEPVLKQLSEEGQMEIIFSPASVDGISVLTVADQSMALWPKTLLRLGQAEGEGLDRILARKTVEAYYKSGSWEEAAAMIPEEYIFDGLKYLPEDDSADLMVSSVLSAVMPGSVDKPSMLIYFKEYLNNHYASAADRLYAYLGLGALGEPILFDLQYLYKQTVDPSAEESMLMALAFAYSGDHQTARFIYQQNIVGSISDAEERYYEHNGKPDQLLTELALLLSAKLSAEECPGLLQYCLNAFSGERCLNAALIAYLDHYVGDLNEEVQVTISMNGNVESHRFRRYAPVSLMLEGEGEVRISSKEEPLFAVCGFFTAPTHK